MAKRKRKIDFGEFEADMVAVKTDRLAVLLDLLKHLNLIQHGYDTEYGSQENPRHSRRAGRVLSSDESKLYESTLQEMIYLVRDGDGTKTAGVIEQLNRRLEAASEAAKLGGWDNYRARKEGVKVK